MRQVLLSCVGRRDPEPENPNEHGYGAVLTLALHLRPDAVVLFPTEGGGHERSSTLPQAAATRERLCELLPGIVVDELPLAISDPSDIALVLNAMRRRVREAVDLHREEDVAFAVNLSSGTGQQKTAWYLLASGGAIPRASLYDVLAPQFVEGSQEPSRRVRPVSLDFLVEEMLRHRAADHIAHGMFAHAAEECTILTSVSISAERRALYTAFVQVAQAYAHWDVFHFGRASTLLAKARQDLPKEQAFRRIRRLLNEQVDAAEALKEMHVETPENLTDLYWNARRAFARGAFVDVLARCRRLVEGALYFRLRSYGIEPSGVEKSSNPEMCARACERLASRASQRERIALGLWDARAILLEDVSDPTTVVWSGSCLPHGRSVDQTFADVNLMRNRSYDGHGMEKVQERDAQVALDLAESAVRRLVGANPEEHALSAARLKEVADHLRILSHD